MDTYSINSAAEAKPRRINIVNCLPDNTFAAPGQATAESAKSAIASLDRAVAELKAGNIDVLVTGPINKKAMVNEGFGFPGHTEYIQNAFGAKDVAMFMVSHRLKLAVVTGHIYLYTDGASSGNPGPGGYGAVLVCGNLRKELSGGFALTTNNRMELLAVIKGLEAIRWKGAQVKVFSDSTYVVNTITKNWKRKKNHDLWARFDELSGGFDLSFNWIKGHAGHPENERCDRLAVAAYSASDLPEDSGYLCGAAD